MAEIDKGKQAVAGRRGGRASPAPSPARRAAGVVGARAGGHGGRVGVGRVGRKGQMAGGGRVHPAGGNTSAERAAPAGGGRGAAGAHRARLDRTTRQCLLATLTLHRRFHQNSPCRLLTLNPIVSSRVCAYSICSVYPRTEIRARDHGVRPTSKCRSPMWASKT